MSWPEALPAVILFVETLATVNPFNKMMFIPPSHWFTCLHLVTLYHTSFSGSLPFFLHSLCLLDASAPLRSPRIYPLPVTPVTLRSKLAFAKLALGNCGPATRVRQLHGTHSRPFLTTLRRNEQDHLEHLGMQPDGEWTVGFIRVMHGDLFILAAVRQRGHFHSMRLKCVSSPTIAE